MNSNQKTLENVETTSLDGLEDVFISTDDQATISGRSTDDPGSEEEKAFPEGGLKLSEAADKFNVTERTIQRWIKEGKLTGRKVAGNHGPEWRVMGESSGDRAEDQPVITGVVENEEETEIDESLPEQFELLKDSNVSIQRMATIVEKLTEQLEEARKELQGASFRNGYLEAQIEAKDERIKLLTMTPAPVDPWWKRFGRWFIGSST